MTSRQERYYYGLYDLLDQIMLYSESIPDNNHFKSENTEHIVKECPLYHAVSPGAGASILHDMSLDSIEWLKNLRIFMKPAPVLLPHNTEVLHFKKRLIFSR